METNHGLCRCVAESTANVTSIKQIRWISASLMSKRAGLPGAIVCSQAKDSNYLTLIYPPPDGRSTDDTLMDIYKAKKLTWPVATIESINYAQVTAFEVAQEQVDFSPRNDSFLPCFTLG